jgi:NCAIR mutase (PurE)-related protein
MVENILRALRSGRLSVPEAARILREGSLPGGAHARFDLRRRERSGIPEIVLAEGKSPEDLGALLQGLHAAGEPAIISRLDRRSHRLLERLRKEGLPLGFLPDARLAVLGRADLERNLTGRTAAVLTAGTADARVAAEVEGTLRLLGARVVRADDVGVAGLHRLLRELPRLQRAHPDVYIVCAGREGALATVVAGLADRPVIGVPTSVGYGRGGKGEAALLSMLQSCAPLAVVNIDAGIPAALVAAQILRAAREDPRRGPGGPKRPRRP